MHDLRAMTRCNWEEDENRDTFTIFVEVPVHEQIKGQEFKVNGFCVPAETKYLHIKFVRDLQEINANEEQKEQKSDFSFSFSGDEMTHEGTFTIEFDHKRQQLPTFPTLPLSRTRGAPFKDMIVFLSFY